MYRYLHQRNYLRSKIKLILSINGHKQLLTDTATQKGKHWGVMDHTAYKSMGYTQVKNYFRLWILAEVEQRFC